MPQAGLLHKTKLDEFVSWLNACEISHRPGRGDYQVIQVFYEGKWHVVYYREANKEHYSVPWPLIPLVNKFIRESKHA